MDQIFGKSMSSKAKHFPQSENFSEYSHAKFQKNHKSCFWEKVLTFILKAGVQKP